MTLHPNLTRAELTEYCLLCHEHRIKSVKVNKETAQAIRRIYPNADGAEYMGIKFYQR